MSKYELELIRGVNCSLILRNLSMRGLVEQCGETETGSPLYQVTPDFLRSLGISQVSELPDFEQLNTNEHLQALLESSTSQDWFAQSPESQA